MHVIDLSIMKLSFNKCTIADFIRLLNLCEKENSRVNYCAVNGNKFYFPESAAHCNMADYPLIAKDQNAECSPVICCASGNNYVLLKTFGENYLLDQHTSVTAFLITLNEYGNDVRILDAEFDRDSSAYLIVFNGNSSN